VRAWVNFEVVLPHTSLLATHGGQATMSAAITHGVPVLVSPLGRDQPTVGARVVERGIGAVVAPDASVDEIRGWMRTLLEDSRFRAAAARAAAELRALGNGRIAIEELESLARH
jgi:UDP:flavonoid glycosyltransferase YjiC (YdhE family)